jgi:hypothetical protein
MAGKDDKNFAVTSTTRRRTTVDALPLCLQANPEEVEDHLESRERRYREDHPKETRYLSACDHGQEDEYRRHVQGAALYPRLQHVALELLDDQVEDGG